MDLSPTLAYWCDPDGMDKAPVPLHVRTCVDPPPEPLPLAELWTRVLLDDEFATLIAPLSPDEFAQLEHLVVAQGCHDPLVLWQETGILLDGYHRFDICRRHRLPFTTVAFAFADRNVARMYVLSKQGGRRNTSPEAASYLRGMRYLAEKQRHGGTRASGQCHQLTTRQRLAAEFNVSESTIARDARFATAIEAIAANCGKQARAAVLARDTGLTRTAVRRVAKMPPDEQRAAIAEFIATGKLSRNGRGRKASLCHWIRRQWRSSY